MSDHFLHVPHPVEHKSELIQSQPLLLSCSQTRVDRHT